MLFRFAGLLLFRFADRQFLALLFQLPPRNTRFEPFGVVPRLHNAQTKRSRFRPLDERKKRPRSLGVLGFGRETLAKPFRQLGVFAPKSEPRPTRPRSW